MASGRRGLFRAPHRRARARPRAPCRTRGRVRSRASEVAYAALRPVRSPHPRRRRPVPATWSWSSSTASATTPGSRPQPETLATLGAGRAALELRDLDGALALQPADGAAAAHEPPARLRVRVLQGGLPALQRAARRRGDRVPASCCRRSVLPTFLQAPLGYRTHARVSMPVLNEHTAINRDFDSYELMPKHNDMAAMLDEHRVRRRAARPSTCSTSARPTTRTRCRTRTRASGRGISGVHGVFKHLDDERRPRRARSSSTRRSCASCADRQIERASSTSTASSPRSSTSCPTNTWVIVTSDHGELFGEDRYFGHGPIIAREGLRGALRRGARAVTTAELRTAIDANPVWYHTLELAPGVVHARVLRPAADPRQAAVARRAREALPGCGHLRRPPRLRDGAPGGRGGGGPGHSRSRRLGLAAGRARPWRRAARAPGGPREGGRLPRRPGGARIGGREAGHERLRPQPGYCRDVRRRGVRLADAAPARSAAGAGGHPKRVHRRVHVVRADRPRVDGGASAAGAGTAERERPRAPVVGVQRGRPPADGVCERLRGDPRHAALLRAVRKGASGPLRAPAVSRSGSDAL